MMKVGSTDMVDRAHTRQRILVRGRVQGVGFRPFIYRSATKAGLSGWIRNTAEGVVVEIEGANEDVRVFLDALRTSAPPNARIASIETKEIARAGGNTFAVIASEEEGAVGAEVSPDIATCEQCLDELFDPGNRRYRYPFISCAHCGPRYAVVESVPYDRARTSMRRFPMCDSCQAEYEDPMDRRFHAETISCPQCGPRLSYSEGVGHAHAPDRRAIRAAAGSIQAGRIVAIKGIGGFHLVADARNDATVERLRAGRRRDEKPFALMFPNLASLGAYCPVSNTEADLLQSAARPIVLLRRNERAAFSSALRDGPWLGALLPYAPHHYLLMGELGFPIVMTSGNIHDEPIVTDNEEAILRLGEVADAFLFHDCPIVRPVEDSLVRIVAGRELILRRARGYAPTPLRIEGVHAGIVGVGAHLKNAVAVTLENAVLLSPHIGDLDTAETRDAHMRVIEDMQALQRTGMRLVASDLHPDYASSRHAEGLAAPQIKVQHHLAHIVSCMAENGVASTTLGVAFDGAGLGADRSIWGGEFLRVEKGQWRRLAHLRAFPLPGGEAAAREPRRAALGLLYAAFGDKAFAALDLPPFASFGRSERTALQSMLARGVNAPLTSSVGRLFDAFAALSGLRQRMNYEGQAAAEMEGAAYGLSPPPYPFALLEEASGELVLDWLPALEAALTHVREGAKPGIISAALHDGLARAIAMVAVRLEESRVALSGGCFQNARLSESTIAALRESGCQPLWHRRVPPNDGGIALGQAVWAAWREASGAVSCA